MENVTIQDVINQRFTNYERVTRFFKQIRFYLKAQILPHSKEHDVLENRRKLWGVLFCEPYPFSATPYENANKVEKGQGIIGEYVRRTTGHVLTEEDLKSFEKTEIEEEIS